MKKIVGLAEDYNRTNLFHTISYLNKSADYWSFASPPFISNARKLSGILPCGQTGH